MALYAISDLHLSTATAEKSMEVFGKRWSNYISRIETNWRRLVADDDTVIIPGDISWALSLNEATADLKFIDALPGKKILGKGNHDFWWCTMKKHREHFLHNGITTIDFLFNNAHETEDFIIAGTRGWFWDEENDTSVGDNDFERLRQREALRLEASLKAASLLKEKSDKEIIVFMHFPPVYDDTVSQDLVSILHKYSIKRVYFGHIHGNYTLEPKTVFEGIELYIISADYLSFTPKFIGKNE